MDGRLRLGGRFRTIIKSHNFEEQAECIEPNCKRFDEIFRSIEWALSRKPEEGKETVKQDVWAITTTPWNTLGLVVYYTLDENEVILLAIKKAEDVE